MCPPSSSVGGSKGGFLYKEVDREDVDTLSALMIEFSARRQSFRFACDSLSIDWIRQKRRCEYNSNGLDRRLQENDYKMATIGESAHLGLFNN